VSLVSSCAYETYPATSSYGGSYYGNDYGNQYGNDYGNQYGNDYCNQYGTPYGTPYNAPYRNHTVSDPTIPLILGASAIGAVAYYSK
jgi:hypothetical protein